MSDTKSTPLVTVAIAVYNDEKYIGACVESVLNQTYEHLQIIIVDDGSTDNSSAIVDQYAADDARVEVIHTENQGVPVARNIGLDRMKGKYLVFIDSDDYIETTMIGRLVPFAEEHELDIVLFGAKYYNHDGTVVDKLPYSETQVLDELEVKSRLYKGDLSVAVWDKFYHRRVWDNVRFDPKWRRGQDFVLQHQYFYLAHRIGCLAEVLYHYELRRSRGNFTLAYHLQFQYQMTKERLAFVQAHDVDYIIDVEEKLVRLALNMWHVYCVQPDKELTPFMPKVREFLRHAVDQPVYTHCNSKRKAMLMMHRYTPTLYSFLLKAAFRYLEPRQYKMLKQG